jgi:hypothetical protein
MRSEILTITASDAGRWVELRTKSGGRATGQYAFELRRHFTCLDVRAALLATGWVEERKDELHLVNWIGCATIGEIVQEMFSYFDRADQPREELLKVIEAVESLAPSGAALELIPIWAYAWLDLIVREDLADEARSAGDVWRERTIKLTTEQHCRERVAELIARYTPSDLRQPLAPSQRQRGRFKPHFRLGG